MGGIVRILLAEDVELVAEAFEVLLQIQPDFEIVARVGRGDEVLTAAKAHLPDIAVLDVGLPGIDGIEAAAALRAEVPSCKVLLLTAMAGSGHVHRALRAGASGYLVKSTSAAQLVDAVRTVVDGGTVIAPDLAAAGLRHSERPLTPRETDILRLIGAGQSTEQVAAELFLTRATVRNYLSTAMGKLGTGERIAAVALAEEHGWL